MRRSMPFGELATLLKTRFDRTEGYSLEMNVTPKGVGRLEYAHVFDSDTPASVYPCDPNATQIFTNVVIAEAGKSHKGCVPETRTRGYRYVKDVTERSSVARDQRPEILRLQHAELVIRM